MIRSLLFVLLSVLCLPAFGQVPSVSYIDNPFGDTEEAPTLYPAADGGFFITHGLTKSTPDSMFGALTRLKPNLAVEWGKVFKMRAKTPLSSLEEASDGTISLLMNGYNTPSRYYPILAKLSANGTLTETREIVDNSSTTASGSFFRRLTLQNGARILIGSSVGTILRLNAQGTVNFAKQFAFANSPNKVLSFLNARSIPGTANVWVGVGYISNTNLSFVLKMQDTSAVSFHVYDFKPQAPTMGMSNIHIYPNQEMLVAFVDNSQLLHMVRLNGNGGIIWRKSYKTYSHYPGKLTVDNNGEIWMSGSITPGQAGGIVAHFSSTGNLLAMASQNGSGTSMGNMQGFEPLPNNEFLTLQRGYYGPIGEAVLYANRIHSTLDFRCYHSNFKNFKDTTYAIVDSNTFQLGALKKSFGSTATLSFPIFTLSPTINTGTVVCTPNAVEELRVPEAYRLVPNPATKTIEIQGLNRQTVVRIFNAEGKLMLSELYLGSILVEKLPVGLYWLDVPEMGVRKRFVKE